MMKQHPPAVFPAADAPGARRRMVAGARRHFFANGFRHVTMDDLAQELGMSKRTFYTHFPSKNDLLRAVLMDKFDEADADLARIAAVSTTDVPAALEQLLAQMQNHANEIQPPFIRDIRREAPGMFQVVEARRADIIQRHFGKIFAEGRKTGMVRKDIPTRLIVEILLGAVQAVVNPAKMAELGLTPKRGVHCILKVVLDGVIVGKGKKFL